MDDFLYDDVISSGEITWQKLKERENRSVNCYLIGPDRDSHLVEGLQVNIVNDPKKTDIIVNTGPWGDNDLLDNYKPLLKEFLEYKPLMICSNPDKKVVRGENFMICAGLIAEYYEKIGGKVKYFGKPFNEIYDFCYKKIENNKKILVIGDSLENDIKGANNQKLDSLLITSGIHREVNINNCVDRKKLSDLISIKKISPKFYMKELKY